jgi:hypothetical protein
MNPQIEIISRDGDGRPVTVIQFIRDTIKKEVEKQLAEKEQK